MPLRVKTNTSAVDARFKQMGWTAKNSLPGYLRQEARLTAVALAFQTQPFGDDDTARQRGAVAVERDIFRVYCTPSQVYGEILKNSDKQTADAFYKLLWSGNKTRSQLLIEKHAPKFALAQIGNFDGGAAHRSRRNNRGRIAESQKPIMLVMDRDRLKNYVQREVNKVGEGKGGWAACARALGGTRGISGWISRQKSPGSVIEHYNTAISSVSMTNEVPYASEIITSAGKADAIRIAGERLAKSVRIAVSHR